LARISTALTQYQTNNNGKLPKAGTCEPSDSTVKGLKTTAGNAAGEVCSFILNYMNSANASDDDESEFVDPTGDPYKLEIAAYNEGTIKDGKQTLDNADYADHVVYLTTKSRCDGEKVVSTKNARDYSILYKLEGSGTYCADNGS